MLTLSKLLSPFKVFTGQASVNQCETSLFLMMTKNILSMDAQHGSFEIKVPIAYHPDTRVPTAYLCAGNPNQNKCNKPALSFYVKDVNEKVIDIFKTASTDATHYQIHRKLMTHNKLWTHSSSVAVDDIFTISTNLIISAQLLCKVTFSYDGHDISAYQYLCEITIPYIIEEGYLLLNLPLMRHIDNSTISYAIEIEQKNQSRNQPFREYIYIDENRFAIDDQHVIEEYGPAFDFFSGFYKDVLPRINFVHNLALNLTEKIAYDASYQSLKQLT
jgi:hypothetical protein